MVINDIHIDSRLQYISPVPLVIDDTEWPIIVVHRPRDMDDQ